MSSLLQLINEVLRRTGQVETNTVTNAPIPAVQAIDFLNETYFEMLQRLNVQQLIKQGSITTSNGTGSYALASDAEINSLIGDSLLEIGTPLRLQEVDYTYPLTHGTSAVGKPVRFYRAGNTIHLYPIPNATYTLQYQYFVKPVALGNDSDTSQLPVEWEKVLILGTQARLEKFLGENGQDTFLLYQDRLGHLKSRSPLKPYRRMKGFYRGYQP